MDNVLFRILMNDEFSTIYRTQLEREDRVHFARSRREIEQHDLELQAQIIERFFSIYWIGLLYSP